jgi:hypothetical protein
LNKKHKPSFNILLLTTLLAGDFFCNYSSNPIQLVLYFFAYFSALTFLENNATAKDFYSEATPPEELNLDKVYFIGVDINTGKEINEDDERFYRIMEPKKMLNRKIFIFAIQLILVFLSFKLKTITFSFLFILPFFTSTLVYLSATLGHLLIPLFLNALFFTLNLKGINTFSIFLYISLFFTTLISFTLTNSQSPKLIMINTFKRNLISSLLPFILCLVLLNHFLLNSPRDFFSNSINKLNQTAGKMLAAQKEISGNDDNKINEANEISSNNSGDFSKKTNRISKKSYLKLKPDPDLNFINDETKKLNFDNRFFNNNPKLPKITSDTSKETLNDILDTLESVKSSNEKHNLRLDKINDKIKDFENTLNENNSSEQAQKKDEINELIKQYNNENRRQEKNNSEIIPTIKPADMNFDKIRNSLQDEKLNTKKSIEDIQKIQNQISQKLKKSNLDINQLNSSNNSPESNSLISPASELNQKPLINEILLNNILNAIKSLIIITLIILILGFLLRYFTKTPIENLKRVDEIKELISTFTKEITALKKIELSPRDEIIKYYELFYLFIKGRHYPESEAPPPTELFHQIESTYSPINNQLKTITDIFCQTVYGKYEVQDQQLKAFRNSINIVFKRIVR